MNKTAFFKKWHPKKLRKLAALDQTLLGLVVLGGILLMILMARALYLNWPQPSVASFLTEKNIVSYVEVNDFELPTKINTGESDMKLLNALGQPFGLEVLPALKHFANNGLAYVLMKGPKASEPVLFIKTQSKGKALDYFKTLLVPGETLNESGDPNPIYSFPQGQAFFFRFQGGYTVIARGTEMLKLMDEPGVKLSDSEDYQKTINNLPHRPWVLGYVEIPNLKFSGNLAISSLLEPLKAIVHNVAFTLQKDQEGVHFNTFANLEKGVLSLDQSKSEGKFTYTLANYLLDDGLGLYIGGADLESEWLNTLETLANLNPAYAIILEGILRAQANQIFGAQIDLRTDFYPLFHGEYAFGLGSEKEGKMVSLILSHDDKGFAEVKMKKLAQGFRFLAAKFAPKVSIVTLPDGTESRELMPDEGKLETTEETVEGYKVHCTEVAGTDVGFCYSVTDEIVIMTNSKERLFKTIEPKDDTTLSQNGSFRKSLANLSKTSDEVTYVDLNNLLPLVGSNVYVQALQPILSKFQAGSWVKHYFTDGVSAEGYVLVK